MVDDITVAEAKQYIAEGHFAPGSMLPKMQAAVEFAESAPGRQSLITLLEKAREGIQGLQEPGSISNKGGHLIYETSDNPLYHFELSGVPALNQAFPLALQHVVAMIVAV